MTQSGNQTMIDWQAVCCDCRAVFMLPEAVHRCLKCKGSLQLECNYDQLKRMVNYTDWQHSPLRPSKYWAALPLSNLKEVVSLQEGVTPLRRIETAGAAVGLANVWAKLESHNPTGSFKDRGTMLEISWAQQQGFTTIVCASTGNMAASVSAYSAKTGMPCFIFVPEGIPVGKLSQIMAYGAKVVSVRGTYNDCVRLTEFLTREHRYFLTGDYALRAEGYKTIAFEIAEQMHWQVPDWVVVPVGNGTMLSGIAKGFKDLRELGLIDALPRFVAAQAALTAPIVEAWKNERSQVVATSEMVNTVAQAANVGVPLDATKALAAIRATKGYAAAVSEDEILSAQTELSKSESIFVEPSAALSWAVTRKLAQQGVIRRQERVVVVLTGHGLKDPKSVLVQTLEPPVIEPTENALKAFWEQKLYNLTKVAFQESSQSAWNKGHVPQDLGSRIRQQFGIDLDEAHVRILRESIERFHEKMDTMSVHSLNFLLEDVTKLPSEYREVVLVADYTITVPLHEQPQARVTVKLNGDTHEAEYAGVGPVDAIITGVREALKLSNKNIPHELVDYDVEIDRGGTDAIVRVHLVLEHPSGTRVTGSAVSPDVITASVWAFERAYNLLYQKVNPKS